MGSQAVPQHPIPVPKPQYCIPVPVPEHCFRLSDDLGYVTSVDLLLHQQLMGLGPPGERQQ